MFEYKISESRTEFSPAESKRKIKRDSKSTLALYLIKERTAFSGQQLPENHPRVEHPTADILAPR